MSRTTVRTTARRRRLAVLATLTTFAVGALVPTASAVPSAPPPASVDDTPPAPSTFDTTPARAAIERLVGARDDLELVGIDAGGEGDRYRVTADAGAVRIEGTSPSTIVAGFRDYLGAELDMSISWNGDNLGGTDGPDLPSDLPLPDAPIEASANVEHRFYGNDTEDGYTGAYRTWEDWERAIDVFAAHGINEVFMPVGTDAVYFDTLTQFGYSTDEILAWIPQPSHQPWWLLQNMSGYPSPVTEATLDARAELGRKIADRLRELGMTPVLPGYFGTVPDEFAERNPGAVTVPQGGWVGFERPDWLSPADGVFAEVADAFYTASEEILGTSTMYKMDLLHEGGTAGGVDVGEATLGVEDALQAANPGATWVLLGWQSNPPRAIIDAADPATTFIVDGLSDRRVLDREASWAPVPYAFGAIWNFGGHTTLGAQLSLWNTRYHEWLDRSGSHMTGVAILPEAGDNNPVAFEFLASRAWSDGPVDVEKWFADFATRRYGVRDESAVAAWDVLRRTVYDLPTDDGWSEAQDALYGATPSLSRTTAASFSPGRARYDIDEFATALPLLLDASPEARATPTYAYDLMDVARQVLSNTSRTLLPRLAEASSNRDAETFRELSDQWLANMDLLDDVVGTQEQNLLGAWLERARSYAVDDEQAAALEVDARSILTTWGDRSAVNAGLNDYANREWQGLVGTYYKGRWEQFLDGQHQRIVDGTPAPAIDWYAVGEEFVQGTGSFPTEASGDIVALATEVVDRHAEAEAPLPDPPSAGTTYVSDMPFVATRVNGAYGPVERDTEVGNAAAGDGQPLTIDGTVYDKGIGVNARAEVDLYLAGSCSAFDAIVGIDDTMNRSDAYPSVIFRVVGDGEVLFDSGTVRAGDPREVSVDVSGVETLTLEADPDVASTQPGAGAEWWDRADWADARVTCGPAVAVEASAELRSVGSRTVLAMRVDNTEDVPVDVEMSTSSGTVSGRVEAGESLYRGLVLREDLDGGTVRVSVTTVGEDPERTAEFELPYGSAN
ncbi:alpha-N-acetylglucosaminidase TIM-barrel domain-containing protein [Isoptericola sp. 178]|uniref:alpha-N-acetylglucosaminidase TIM-barrel domain-containing protein n=1 Tax=Isoptericola sp. 178 TaxID=3064651 RepID=UPI002713C701|nr:alpha-N-acetylglucosaminidase TIM-barrel domain-containing protein [Isoptericola sp. 178]MDO8145626.1 alpha-N-acetylglucosaminidase TIM-barrel domain-containing protein [Isoptericola sp. 178]